MKQQKESGIEKTERERERERERKKEKEKEKKRREQKKIPERKRENASSLSGRGFCLSFFFQEFLFFLSPFP